VTKRKTGMNKENNHANTAKEASNEEKKKSRKK